jgi:L-iditol 2-dehydrogenase
MSPSKNVGAVLHGINDLRVEEINMPAALGPGDVLIAIRSVGICGSDAHYLTHGRIGNFVCDGPMTLGHESSGVVQAVGEGVTKLVVGDRVALEPGVPCGSCEFCKAGRYNICQSVKFAATPPVDGSLAHLFVHPESFSYKIPDSMSFDIAALLEPLSVGIYACRRAGVGLGHCVLITGAGAVGLLALVAARAAGAHRIFISDISQERLDVAKKMGADEVLLIGQRDDEKSEAEKKAYGERIGADACIECSGAESGAKLCIYGAKPGSCVVLVGMGKPDMILPVLYASTREVGIRGIFRYCNTYPTAIALASSVDLSALITHRFPLKDASKAFDCFLDREQFKVKIIIDCTTENDQLTN